MRWKPTQLDDSRPRWQGGTPSPASTRLRLRRGPSPQCSLVLSPTMFLPVAFPYDFQWTAARRAVLAALNPPLPPKVPIPSLSAGTPELKRALMSMAIFGHIGLWKLLASFLLGRGGSAESLQSSQVKSSQREERVVENEVLIALCFRVKSEVDICLFPRLFCECLSQEL